jgi:hypothetical protein
VLFRNCISYFKDFSIIAITVLVPATIATIALLPLAALLVRIV